MTRDFTVAVFVVWQGCVLLHPHRKLGLWLPPGGHIEANELPDQAAVREVLEESGVRIVLESRPAISFEASSPVLLAQPRGVQLEDIEPGHQHIDLVYFAVPKSGPEAGYDGGISSEGSPFGWYAAADLESLGVSGEVLAWCQLALSELGSAELA
jgi:8-oxo-dGTP pyrophosphatase MutT (NUDIX family)